MENVQHTAEAFKGVEFVLLGGSKSAGAGFGRELRFSLLGMIGVDGMTTLFLPTLKNGTASERSIQRTRIRSLMASSFATAPAFLVL